MSEITRLYKARFSEPRLGTKVFIVTCQTKDGWKGLDQETSARVPELPERLQSASDLAARGIPAPAEPLNSQNPYMHKAEISPTNLDPIISPEVIPQWTSQALDLTPLRL